VGSDIPGVTRETALAALDALEVAELVVGPAEDGGYYLIALREPHPELVRGIGWSTPAVLAQTLERAKASRLRVHALEPLRDVDTLADLRAAWPALEGRLAGSDELRRALARAAALPG
jgi:uncharacterized protein